MANKMKDFLPKIDMEKMQTLLEVEEKYETGKITLDEAREILRTKVGSIRPYHLAFIEQNMKSMVEDECIRADMRKIIELVEGFMDNTRLDLPSDHPLMHYYKENDEMRRLLLAVEDLIQYPVIKNQWLELYDQIRQYPIHYQRKQNQLYPLLEKKGFDRPTTTMWNFDDIIRDEIKESLRLLDAGDEEAFIAAQSEFIAHARDLMEKEETILYPTSHALISAEEFEDMKSGDQEIGFAFFKVDFPSTPNTQHSTPNTQHSTPNTQHPKPNTQHPTPQNGFAEDLQALLSKYGYSAGPQQELDVATGKLTLEQINLIYKHLPIDISFVDENELVKFYSDTDHRIFPRSKNVIGRQVSNCHPRKSVHIVEEIVEKFRNGEQDKAEFWINKPEVFLYIVYYAVRDAEGHFRGVLEMMQDCTHIRELTGSQTLLTWAGEKTENKTKEDRCEDKQEKTTDEQIKTDIEITPDTRLKDLFDTYPHLKKELASRYPSFKMLNTPLGKLILKKATVRMASERSGLGEERFINLIKECI